MSRLVHATLHDLRWGRQSWRVLLLLAIPALATGVALGMAG